VIGEFDGFHIGHQRMFRAARALAQRNDTPILAFVVDVADGRPRLLSIEDRARHALLSGASAVNVVTAPDRHRPGTAGKIVESVLEVSRPAVAVIMCSLHQPGGLVGEFERRGVKVVEVERTIGPHGEVTSDAVRRALGVGEVTSAHQLLGRPPTVVGPVIRGAGLGRTIGFATANIRPPGRFAIPAEGVYAGTIRHPAGISFGAINVGRRPTVESNGEVLVEAHLLDFTGDLYDAVMTVDFLHRVRRERKFASIDELVVQLRRDVASVRTLLSHLK
jgi:riboflavin kinase/FMN adenylyltransferase